MAAANPGITAESSSAADGRLPLFGPILQHGDMMPRQPDAQFRGPECLFSLEGVSREL